MRSGKVTRATKETEVTVAVNLDGSGRAEIATGIGFLDHMLELLARHSRIDISVAAKGDLHIDQHHTTEDVGIVLGQAVKKALGDLRGITRYADVHVPMDEALTRVAIDVSGRPVLVFRVEFPREAYQPYKMELGPDWPKGITAEPPARRGNKRFVPSAYPKASLGTEMAMSDSRYPTMGSA